MCNWSDKKKESLMGAVDKKKCFKKTEKRRREEGEKIKVGSCFGSLKEEGEAETLIKDKRLFSVSLLSFVCLSNFYKHSPHPVLSSFFFLIYCSGKHIPPLSVHSLQHGRLLYSLFSGHTHTCKYRNAYNPHTCICNFCILGTNKHAHA